MDICVKIISSGRRSESPLFCTPPPSDTLAELTHSVDSNVISTSNSLVFISTKRSYQRGTTDVYEGGPANNQRKTRKPQTRREKGHCECSSSNTSTIEASLTLMDASPARMPARARDDFCANHSPKPRSQTPITPGKGQALHPFLSSKLSQVYPSLSHLTGYATSEDEDARDILVQSDKSHITSRQARRTRSLRVPKSEEYIVDDISSGADAERSPGKQSCMYKCHHIARPGELKRKTATQSMLDVHERGQDLDVEGSHSMKDKNRGSTRPKGAYNAAAPKNRKAPKTKGGFVLSDDSEAEDLQATGHDERVCHPPATTSTSHTVKLPKPRPVTSTDKHTINSKQLNKTRLSKLLGRHKSPFHQGPPKAVSSPPASRNGPTAPIYTPNKVDPSQPRGVQISMDQNMQPNVGTTVTPRTLQDARSVSSNPPLQTQQHVSRDGTTMSLRPSASSVPPNTISAQHAKQPLRRSQEPLLAADGHKRQVPDSSQQQLPVNIIQGQKQETKSPPHKIASKPPVSDPQSAQKRQVKDMMGDVGGSTATSKKRSTMFGGRIDDSDRRREVFQSSKFVADSDGSPPVTPVVDAPMASSSNSAMSPQPVFVAEASSRPQLLSLNVVPSATTAIKASRVTSNLCTEDVRTLKSAAISAKDKQVSSHLLPALPEDCSTGKTTSQMDFDLVPNSAVVRQDSKSQRSTEQQQQILFFEPAREIPNLDTSLQVCAPNYVKKNPDIELLPMASSADAEPHFEYSVFERRWSDEQDEYDVKEVGVILRPFIDLNEANNQVEQLFQRVREEGIWHTQNTLSDWTSKRDEYGCLICKASFAQFDNPYQEHFVKVWVQRDYVSKLANRTPSEMKRASFISSTVYALRLSKMIMPFEESDSEETVEQARSPIRVYQPLIRSEVYTTLYTANRAARDQQLEISHEKNAKNLLTLKWQEQNVKDLEQKLRTLSSSRDGEGACWESQFNSYGIGGDQYELVVEKLGICGPRNL